MASEHFILQKLQHRRCQRLRYAVDLINKQNPLPVSGALLIFINGTYDLAHRILGHGIFCIPEPPIRKLRKSYGTLSCVMSDRICDQTCPALRCRLFHNGRLPDSRRTNQQHRPLTNRRNPIAAAVILCRIRTYSAYNLFLRFFDVHISVPSRVNVSAQSGALPFLSSSFRNTNAVS